jgi:PadR family transcriptional regulator PadR
MSSEDISELLETWEGNYKKGLLTFWILLLLNERESYAFEMSELIEGVSNGTIQADEKSVYRALYRFEKMELVQSSWRDSEVGPQRRYYRLSGKGLALLQSFIRRNILLFQKPNILNRIERVLSQEGS